MDVIVRLTLFGTIPCNVPKKGKSQSAAVEDRQTSTREDRYPDQGVHFDDQSTEAKKPKTGENATYFVGYMSDIPRHGVPPLRQRLARARVLR